jgi:hypothetical protein
MRRVDVACVFVSETESVSRGFVLVEDPFRGKAPSRRGLLDDYHHPQTPSTWIAKSGKKINFDNDEIRTRAVSHCGLCLRKPEHSALTTLPHRLLMVLGSGMVTIVWGALGRRLGWFSASCLELRSLNRTCRHSVSHPT